jgi:hypothetical protein
MLGSSEGGTGSAMAPSRQIPPVTTTLSVGGQPTTGTGEASGHAKTASGSASGHHCDLRSPPFLFRTSGVVENSRFNSSKTPEMRSGERTPNPLYRSNSTAFANVLTPPSDLVMCECVSIFTIIFRGDISSIQMHMIMKCTPRGT